MKKSKLGDSKRNGIIIGAVLLGIFCLVQLFCVAVTWQIIEEFTNQAPKTLPIWMHGLIDAINGLNAIWIVGILYYFQFLLVLDGRKNKSSERMVLDSVITSRQATVENKEDQSVIVVSTLGNEDESELSRGNTLHL